MEISYRYVKAGMFVIGKTSNMNPKGRVSSASVSGGGTKPSTATASKASSGRAPKSPYRDNYASNRRSFREAENLMLSNFESKEKTTYITLKYDIPEFSTKKFHNDMKMFFKAIRRKYKENPMKYIYATELSHDLSYHVHCIIFWEDKAPKDIDSFWNNGTAYSKSIKKDEEFLYLVRYLTGYNRETTDDEREENFPGLTDEEIARMDYFKNSNSMAEKKIIKTERLKKMPAGIQLFPHSRGMKKAEVKECSKEEYEKTIGEEKDCLLIGHTTKDINGFIAQFDYAARFVG